MLMGFMSFIVIIGGFFLLVMVLYNRLVAKQNQVKNAFSQIDVQLQRRHDLIPTLVETARGYLKHEQETLTRVIEARNQAVSLQRAITDGTDSAAAVDALAQAERQLSGWLSKLMAVVEQYPDLKADKIMQQLMEELTTTENRIGFARQTYNDDVMFYNNACQMFPSNLVAGAFSFKPRRQLVLDELKIRQAPAISF